MSRKIFFTFFVVMIFTTIFAKHSDDFIIGEYRSYENDQELEWLSEAKFNMKRYNLSNNSNLQDLENMLVKYDNYGLDMRLADRLWDTNDNEYGSYYATFCNDYKFQMEFTEIEPTGFDIEKWFYQIKSENSIPNGPYTTIENEALVCHESIVGNGLCDWKVVDYLWSRPDMTSDNILKALINYNASLFNPSFGKMPLSPYFARAAF